ncbi:hypothetical protein [Streptomyces sp. NPDC003720]|uniref:hypothetical protein n=1 Tax=Streptomyces sp. NPDC003720 TaxID=3364684 RepID=UPI003692476B
MSSHQRHHPAPQPSCPGEHQEGHGGHRWMMIACCVPMIIVAVVLVATSIVSIGWLFAAFACLAMMALMMRGMSDDGHR